MRSASLNILIPHYQDPKGLHRSLQSISDQDWGGRACVIVSDDGSDNSIYESVQNICEDFRQEGRQEISLIRRNKNRGRPYTRNELLDASQASHIAWLDSGDTWSPSKLKHQFRYLSEMYRGGRDLSRTWITCDYDWIEGGGEPQRVKQDVSGDQLQKLLVGSRLRAYLWTLLGTRESFLKTGYFDDRLPRLQDLDYFIRFVRGGGKILRVRDYEAFATYYKSDVGRSSRQVYEAYRIILKKNEPALKSYPPSFHRELKYRSAKLSSRFAKNNGNMRSFIKYEVDAFSHKPINSSKNLIMRAIRRLTR